MITLSEAKQWLRLEESDTAEDALLLSLIDTATEYVRNAVPSGITLDGNPIAGLLVRVLVADWHENRTSIGQVRPEMLPTIRVLVTQLQCAYPVVETVWLPDATVGVSYYVALMAGGGVPPYAWSIESGTLPDGLDLEPDTGVISGTPTATGNFSFAVRITDRSVPAKTASRTFDLKVVEVS